MWRSTATIMFFGTAGLHICWEDLGEIRSVAVAEKLKGRGIGRALIKSCLEEAKTLGLSRAFVLTNKAEFFTKVGFVETVKEEMPLKIWMDCVKCVKYPDECDEVPMTYSL